MPQPKRTYLEDISVIELSPTSAPANGWRSVFQRRAQEESEMPATFESAIELLEKSDLSASAKKAATEGFGKFAKVMDELPAGMQKAIRKAMAFIDEEAEAEKEKEKKSLKKTAEDAAVELTSIRDLIEKSVALLDSEKPAVGAALEGLAGLVGHKTMHQQIAELPAELRSRFELLEKSAKESDAKLALVAKSQAETAKAERVRTMISKAEATLQHVPLETASLGEMLTTVADMDPKAGAALFEMFTRVEGVLSKSKLFEEKGSALGRKVGGGSAWTEIDDKARAIVQKSEADGKAIPLSKARSFVMETHPELAQRASEERPQG
jgi:hypothetical protein